ncbi:M56 family metallopeptidase [Phycisphaerales bacterium AB-hyl4]|uniref:M56 family metallopeptidase n=1 Tax=Natronomicrosphaera hydrolytica TaxID=3242702 RepID=A0ABV4U8Y8_9BACT
MQHLLPLLLDVAIKSTVILLLAAIVTALMRRHSAAARHTVWTAAIAAVLGLPVLAYLLPGLAVLPTLPTTVEVEPHTTDTAPTPFADAPAAGDDGSILADAPPPAGDGRSVPAPAGPAVSPTDGAQAIDDAPAESAPMTLAEAEPASPTWRVMLAWLPWVWLGGASFALLPIVFGALGLMRLKRTSQPITASSWQHLLRELQAKLNLQRPVVLRRSRQPIMPMTWGCLPGVPATVLVPVDSEDWSPQRRRAVLLHELAHVKRYDCLTQLLTQVACAVYWFNPLMWYAAHRMLIERERACDDLVLTHETKASEYAQHLLDIATGPQAGLFTAHAGIAMARRSKLDGRLVAILDQHRNRRAMSRLGVALTITLIGAVAVPVAMLQADVESAESSEPLAEADEPPYRATFIDDVHVELVGVAQNFRPDDGEWWSPDGQRLDDAPYDELGTWSNEDRPYEIAVKISNPDLDLVARGPAGTSVTEVRAPGARSDQYPTTRGFVVSRIDDDTQAIDLQLGLAHGDWREVVHWTLDWTAVGTTVLNTTEPVVVTSPEQRGDAVVIDVSHAIMDRAVRLVSTDNAGNQHIASPQRRGRGGDVQSLRYTFDGLTLEQLDTLSVESRPYRWVEFRNVSLQPGHETEVEVEVVVGQADSVEGETDEEVSALEPEDDHRDAEPAFGLVIEHTIEPYGRSENDRLSFLDLDTGEQPMPKPDIREADSADFTRWAEDAGIDLIRNQQQPTHDAYPILTHRLLAFPVDDGAWDQYHPRTLVDFFNHLAHLEPATVGLLDAKGELPLTYRFKTRAGSVGVLQITGFTNTGGVQVQYKLVENYHHEVTGAAPDAALRDQVRSNAWPIRLTSEHPEGWVDFDAAAGAEDEPAEYRWSLEVDRDVTVLHGWASYGPDGSSRERVDSGGVIREPNRRTIPLMLDVAIEGDQLVLTGGTRRRIELPGMEPAADDEAAPMSLQTMGTRRRVPEGARLRMRTLPADQMIAAQEENYQTLWEGQWVRDGEVVRTIRYMVRVAAEPVFRMDEAERERPVRPLPDHAQGHDLPTDLDRPAFEDRRDFPTRFVTHLPLVEPNRDRFGTLLLLDLSPERFDVRHLSLQRHGLPVDASPEALAREAEAGDLYMPEANVLVTVRGAVVVPFESAERPRYRDANDLLAQMTRRDVAEQVQERIRSAERNQLHRVEVQEGEHLVLVRADGEAFFLLIGPLSQTEAGDNQQIRITSIPLGRLQEINAGGEPAEAHGHIRRHTLRPDEREMVITWQLDLPDHVRLVRGWYITDENGQLREHGGGGDQKLVDDVDHKTLSLRLGFGADELTFTATLRRDHADGPRRESSAYRTAIPPNATFQWQHLAEPTTLGTDEYVMLWRGQWLREGTVVKSVVYAARVAAVDEPIVGFFAQQDPVAGRVRSIAEIRRAAGAEGEVVYVLTHTDVLKTYALPADEVLMFSQLLGELADDLPNRWRAELVRSGPGEREARRRHLQPPIAPGGHQDVQLQAGDVILIGDGGLYRDHRTHVLQDRLEALQAQRELPGVNLAELNRRIARTQAVLDRLQGREAQ